jgi:hypothetical protein
MLDTSDELGLVFSRSLSLRPAACGPRTTLS